MKVPPFVFFAAAAFARATDAHDTRILIDDISLNMFTNICRGLFEKDKMLYAFMIAVGILRQAGKVGIPRALENFSREANGFNSPS